MKYFIGQAVVGISIINLEKKISIQLETDIYKCIINSEILLKTFERNRG